MKAYNLINHFQWADFVYNHPHGNIFQIPEMYHVYQKTKNYEPIFITIINEQEEILATQLAVIEKKLSGILGYFTARSIIYGGPLIKDNDKNVLDFILKEYKKIIRSKAIYTQFRNFWDWRNAKEIFRENGFKYEKHLNVIHDLNISENEQLMQMHKGRRKNIRRAIKKNVVFKEIINNQEMEIALSLIEETYKRVKLPLPDKSFFLNIYNVLNPKNYVKFFVAKHEEEIIGARFVFCYKNLVYDWFAGSSDAHLDKYPNDYLPWKVMLWGKINGFKTFDFGGAGKPEVSYGVRDYKLKFGGKMVDFGRFEKVHKSLLMKFGQIGLNIYKIF